MRCHTCPHHDYIQRGDYSSKPWNETPCSSCKAREDWLYSVPFDEEKPPVPALGYPALSCDSDSVVKPRSVSDTVAEEMPVDALARFFDGMLRLPSELRDIVAWRFLGVSYKEIAKRQGTSIQLAEMRHKRAIRECPLLRSLFPEKVAKRRRRISRK